MEKEKKRRKRYTLVLYAISPQSWSFPALLGQETCSSPFLPAGLLGAGSAVLILRCVCLGGDAPPPARCQAQWELFIL